MTVKGTCENKWLKTMDMLVTKKETRSMANWSLAKQVKTYVGKSCNPSDGLYDKDGEMCYTLGLIDCLVPFDFYPCAQYLGTQLITCGGGLTASRVPPEYYYQRQVNMMMDMCGVSESDVG